MTADRPSDRTLGVGVVGLSAGRGWAALAHVPALRAVPGLELRAVAASSAENARRAAAAFDIPVAHGSAAELAADPGVDLVVITVRVPRHRELVRAALNAGKAVFCEWPVGIDVAETRELLDLATHAGVRTAVGLQVRWVPELVHLGDLVAGGYVGRPLATSILASGVNWGATVTPDRLYQLDRRNGATMLTIPFGHTLEALCSVLGDFVDLTATTAVQRPEVRRTDTGDPVPMTAEDQIAVTGVLTSGAVASMHLRGGTSRGTGFRWEINGTEGDLVVEVDPPMLQLGRVRLRGARGDQTQLGELPLPPSCRPEPWARPLEGTPALPVALAYDRLRQDLLEGSSQVPDFAHALRRHAVLDRIQRAADRG